MGIVDRIQKEKKPTWELIGKEEYGKKYFNDVPTWVRKELERLQSKHSWHDAASGGKRFYLKGRTYRYRLTPAGQGGPITYIERKLRERYWDQSVHDSTQPSSPNYKGPFV